MRTAAALPFVLAVAALVAAAAAGAAASPFVLRGERETSLLVAGGLLGAAGAVLQRDQDPLDAAALARLDPADVNALDRGATRRWSASASEASDLLVAALLVAPAGVAAAGGLDDERAVPLVMYAETLLLAEGATQLLKGACTRTRPYAYNDDPAIPPASRLDRDARRSFPSSHAASAFAAAVFLGRMHDAYHPGSGARTWVWTGALAAATATAVLRCTAGRHFPTDALAGAAIGAAAGWVVPALHRARGSGRVTWAFERGVAVSVRF